MDGLINLLKFVWRVLDEARRATANLLFLLLAIIVVLAVARSDTPLVPGSGALVLSPSGRLVEELSGDPVERAFERSLGREHEPETLVRDVVDAVDAARDDERITALVLDLDGLWGGGLSKLQEIAAAVRRFRAAGKPVFAIGDNYSQDQYLIAAQADTVLMDPYGLVFIDGFGTWQLYYKQALDKLGIEWNVFRVGEYKSFVEPFTRDSMSREAREANLEWLDALWAAYRAEVQAARGGERDVAGEYVSRLLPGLRAVEGDFGRLAVDAGLVDRLATRQEVIDLLAAEVGADDDGDSFQHVGWRTYLGVVRTERSLQRAASDKVQVIVAAGTIMDGTQPPGTVGGDSTAQLVRSARLDEAVKAIVLRVDSPGGSTFASELVLRELELARADGKPVVVSMGSVAASGGYWIALGADEVIAAPTTITGSIGIFGMFPTLQGTLAKLGVRSDGVGTTPYSDALRMDRAMSADVRGLLQASIDNGYQRFLARVAAARGKTVEEVDRIARGRVWTGARALELGLVDRLGSLQDAVESAASRAGLEEYEVRWSERELSFTDRMLINLFGDLRLGSAGTPAGAAPLDRALADLLRSQWELLARFNDPRGSYAYCFCGLR